ncbi:MAG TPA: efflux transporter outer membrane subunit [Steroidobacteraceae bacterium]|nr:efflux transporter outer membrane subunit [Steroidobacteraceae bacterium]
MSWRRAWTPPARQAGRALAGAGLTLVAAACVLALDACAVGPNYHRPSVPPAPGFKEGQGWAPATPAQISGEEWWLVYDDPVLSSLEKQVAVSNQNLKAAVASYYAAREAAGVTRGTLLPSIGLGGSGTRSGGSGSRSQAFSGLPVGVVQGGSGTRTLYDANANASWDLDIWGKIRRQLESDLAQSQASAADVAAARLSAQAALAEDYFQLRAAEQELRLLKTSVQDYQVSLQIAQNRVNAGVTTLADVYSARTLLENTQSQENTVELSRAKLEHAIAVLIGKAPAELALAEGQLAATVPVVPAGVPSQLLLRRPDIAASERSLAGANARIGVAEAAWFPSLTLSGSYGYESSSLPSLIRASNSVWSFGPSLAETVFNGGARLAQTREARALYDSAVANYRQTVLTAFQQVEDDLATLRYLQTDYTQEQQALADAERSEALTLNQYKAGVADYASVLSAQTARLNTEISALTVQDQRLVASVDLIDAIGGGWDSAQLNERNDGVAESLKATAAIP